MNATLQLSEVEARIVWSEDWEKDDAGVDCWVLRADYGTAENPKAYAVRVKKVLLEFAPCDVRKFARQALIEDVASAL